MRSEQHLMRLLMLNTARGLFALFIFVTYLSLFYIPFTYRYAPRVFQLSNENVAWGRVQEVTPCDVPLCAVATIAYYPPNIATGDAQVIDHHALMSGEQFARMLSYGASLLQKAEVSLANVMPQPLPVASRWGEDGLQETVVEAQTAAQPTQMRSPDDLIAYISSLGETGDDAPPLLPPHLTWLIPTPDAYVLLQHFPAGAPWPYLPPFVHYWLLTNITLVLVFLGFLTVRWLWMPIQAGIHRMRFLRTWAGRST